MRMRNLLQVAILLSLFGCTQDASLGVAHLSPVIDQDGQILDLREQHGKWLVLNFWASWCTPCRKEIPAISAFYDKHHDDVEIIGVNMDPMDSAKLSQLAREFGATYPLTSTNLADQLGIAIQFMPTTIFIDPQGNIVKQEVKEQTQASLEATIAIS